MQLTGATTVGMVSHTGQQRLACCIAGSEVRACLGQCRRDTCDPLLPQLVYLTLLPNQGCDSDGREGTWRAIGSARYHCHAMSQHMRSHRDPIRTS